MNIFFFIQIGDQGRWGVILGAWRRHTFALWSSRSLLTYWKDVKCHVALTDSHAHTTAVVEARS